MSITINIVIHASYISRYGADGTLLQRVSREPLRMAVPVTLAAVTRPTVETVHNHIGAMTYRKGALWRIDTPSGYISADGQAHFYIRDHQGNVRQVTDSDGNVEQDNHYYPYGMLMGESGDILATARNDRNPLKPSDANPYLYGSKEYLTTGGANLLDFTARTYDPSTLLFHTPDPLRDNYLPVNSYLYCSADPVNRIDPTGCGDFLIEDKVLGWDGKDDGKAYVLKTTQSEFNSDGETVNGAGLLKKDAKATKEFIIKNSGNSEAFTDDCIAYANCIEIEGSVGVRNEMIEKVSKDNGKGGSGSENNREHGGYIENGEVISVKSGPVCNLSNDEMAYIDMPDVDGSTFHSHPSGSLNYTSSPQYHGSGTSVTLSQVYTKNSRFYTQHPSKRDINNAAYATHYVIGRRDNKVYIYNLSGIQAVVNVNIFTTAYNRK